MGHHHLPVDHLNRAFVLGIVLNLVFVCVEFGAGLWFDSVALISDAGHNLSDVVSLVLSLIAFRLARVKPTASYTYGYRKYRARLAAQRLHSARGRRRDSGRERPQTV